jgi:glycosyltransferase involved in cell wall biosynthesis
VALFTDCFQELNGVGTLSREFVNYARESGRDLFCAFGSDRTELSHEGCVSQLKLRRGPASFSVDADLRCDPLLTRHRNRAVDALLEFKPDLVHITGPGDISILGLWVASLVGVPAFASWHTNLHEYAYRRLQSSLSFLPGALRNRVSGSAGQGTLWAVTTYYKIAHFVAAPNQQMVDLLKEKTNRPSFLMRHGVNTSLFHPGRRTRAGGPFRIGYVGRLTPEKNVRSFTDLERELLHAGAREFEMVLIGDGSEREWLMANLEHAHVPGPLRGTALAEAFANFDAFVFPSLTDTFGLVILEAMASGVPVIATPTTGTRAGVAHGENGLLTSNFAEAVLCLMRCEESRRCMGNRARRHAEANAWSGVFDDFYRIYSEGLCCEETLRRWPTPKRFARNGNGNGH